MSGRPRLRFVFLAVVLALGASSCAGTVPATRSAVLSGRVTFRGAPVPGATVSLRDRYGPGGNGVRRTVRCADDGGFSVPIAPGTYYVAAEGSFEGTAVFAFSGQNPVNLGAGSRWLGMKAVPKETPGTVPGRAGRGASVAGVVLYNGAPVEDAYVFLYSSPASLFKGMGIAMSPPTAADGSFLVENLPESSYYLVARRRGAGGLTGPLEKGDLYGFHPANPVYLTDGAVTRVRIETVEKEKPLSYAEVTAGAETALKGRVVDRAGAPQAGVYAFVYEDRVFGHQRPYAHSGRTGADGAFAIYVDRPGVYYLGARENFGNSPRPGERFGFYDGTPDHAVTIGAGTGLSDLVVVVDRILPEGR